MNEMKINLVCIIIRKGITVEAILPSIASSNFAQAHMTNEGFL
jgi:hypothetical protein